MIVEIGNGKDGLKEYLETGKKKGRELHRDQLDQRIPLFGDLNVFELATSTHGGTGTKYNHITLSFSENHVSDEMLQIAVNEFREHALAAWPESERYRIAFYAEAHRPKMLSYVNSETGNAVDRCTHIHIGIGRHDTATGKAIEPLGFLGLSDNLKYIDAWQESFNSKYGFSSPKDNPKVTPENAIDVLARYTGSRPDAMGNFNGQKATLELTLQKEIVAGDVTTWAGFGKLLAKYGEVSKVNEGKFGECYRIKPRGSERAMRLKGVFFQRDFIERATVEKTSLLMEKAKIAYLEQMRPRKEPRYVAKILDEWTRFKARENRYFHTDSKFYKEVYQPAGADARLQILNKIESENNVLSGSLATKSRKTPTARSRMPGLPIRDMDGIQRRAEMLLRGGPGMDVSAESIAGPDGLGLRQANGRERRSGGDRAGSGLEGDLGPGKFESGRAERPTGQGADGGFDHVGQPSSVLGRMHADLLDRYEQAAAKERYAEIRRNLDCTLLLNSLSHSHGLKAELYQVTTGKDGTARIQCGTRALSPSDFLSRELGLPWKEAAPILRRVYEQQIGKAVTSPRGKAITSPLWQEFKAERKVTQVTLGQRLKAFDVESRSRHAALKALSAVDQKKHLTGLAGVARKAATSLEKLRAATRKAELTAALAVERQSLYDAIQPAEAVAWRLFLQARAQAGSEEALAELRKLDDTPRTVGPSITGTIELDDEEERKQKRRVRVPADASILRSLAHAVELNGDITYRHMGQAVLRDEGRNIAVLDQNSNEAIAAGLLIAREKFGTNLTLTGSAEFQRRVVAVAVAQGIAVRFVDPQLEAIRQQLADDKYKAPRTPARPLQQIPAQDLAPSNESAKRAVAVPAVDPHQAATAPAQPTATRKTKRAAAPVAAEVPAAVPRQVTPPASAPQQIPAHVWLATWAAEENKIVVRATPESGNTAHTVVYIGLDGVVLNKGRSGAVYEVPKGVELTIGAKVFIDQNSQIHMPNEIEAEKGGRGK